jgi:hypothetical protein
VCNGTGDNINGFHYCWKELTMTRKAFHSDQIGIRKNLLINGDMSVAQRLGAINTAVGAVDWTYQSADRWKTLQKAGTAWAIYTHNAVPVGSSSRTLLFNSGGNSTKAGAIQIVENIHTWATLGRRVSLQFQLLTATEITDVRAAVLGWTGAADAVTNPISAWNGSGLNPTLAANWGYLNTPSALVGGSTYTLLKLESLAVPTNVTNIAVMFWCEDETQTLSTQSWAITDVQLEIGTKCTQFERLFIQDTLRLAQRYYYKSGHQNLPPSNIGNACYAQPVGTAAAVANRMRLAFPFPVPMRAAPTIRHWDNLGNLGKVSFIETDTITDNNAPTIAPMLTSFAHYALLTSDRPVLFSFDASAEL